MARPSSYDPEFAKQAEKLCTLGATDAELADFFEISVSTIYRWANAYKEFCDALKAGKEACDERVVRSLYNRAVGYTFDSEKIVVVDKKVERVAIMFAMEQEAAPFIAALDLVEQPRPATCLPCPG